MAPRKPKKPNRMQTVQSASKLLKGRKKQVDNVVGRATGAARPRKRN